MKKMILVLFFLITSVLADAAVVNITADSASGYTMTDGNTYVIQNSVTFTNSLAGGSGMSVANNATVVLCVPQGVTLTAKGADGAGQTGGGAGIRVPKTSTLIISGEGSVNVTGGNAGDGGNGYDGQNGHCSYDDVMRLVAVNGAGRAGGAGGGGAGAGIGGNGGYGGSPSGGDGSSAGDMGTVYILGSLQVMSFGGSGGIAGQSGLQGETWYGKIYTGSYRYAYGGGGGGGGGAGSPPSYSIGGGGASGGAGGKGHSLLENYGSGSYSDNCCGGGGSSLTDAGEGGAGYPGGAAGAEGGDGTLYVSPEATVNVDRAMLTAATHSAAQYAITFDAKGGTIPAGSNDVSATLGCALPDCIPSPIRRGYLLNGWSDGNGVEYYGGNGEKMLSAYLTTSNIMLYADWQLDPNRLVVRPADGTIFTNSLTVSMSTSVEGSTIRYTTDGSDPTSDSPIYKKSKISGKTTFKAIAFYDDGANSEIVTASYALGQCADPIVSPADGTVFNHSGLSVSIDQNGEEGVLRYTVDGAEPTKDSPLYAGPFTVDDSTVVKAKVFSDSYFDSSVVTVNLTRDWETVSTPVISAATEFVGEKTKVVISCATTGATIHYTTNGNDPTSHSPVYTRPIWVNESCTIKASAMCAEYLTSAVASHAITKVWGIGDTMGVPDHVFTSSGDAVFSRVEDATAPSGEAMRSGTIGNSAAYGLYTRSVLSTTVQGPGTLTFKWRSSCEQDNDYEWDHAEFAVDGVLKKRINDITEWKEVSQSIEGAGEHVITWTYLKDDSEGAGEDCLLVADYSWVTDEPYTHETTVPIPYEWLADKCRDVVDEYDSYEKVAKQTAYNGRLTVEQCYVAGVDPESHTNDFKTVIEMVDGVPHITWSPDLKTERNYKVYGSTNLVNGGDWEFPTNSLHRFFKVSVEMP